MSKNNKSRKLELLWVDDNIDNMDAYVNILAKAGYNITTAKSMIEAMEISNKITFDIILVDIRMPHNSGIELIRNIMDEQKNARFAVLSSFLYLQQYKEELKTIKIPLKLIDKVFSNPDDELFYERFLGPIEELTRCDTEASVGAVSIQKTSSYEIDPFTIEFKDFIKLPIEEKDKLIDTVEKIAENTIENSFKRSKIWILLCGNKDDISASAEDIKEILSEDEIIEYARKMNRAPYQFFKTLSPEDHWASCADDISLKDYPTVSLKVNDENMLLHFDTGAPWSFLSYEEFVAKGAIRPASFFGNHYRKGFKPCKVVKINDLKVLLNCPKTGQSKSVMINGEAIRDWHNSSYARFCEDHCEHKKGNNEKKLCPLRRGLIGRNILVDNGIKLTLDGIEKTTYFSKEEDEQ